MGCTPSIHVSQTGVVYCRESDDSNSPRPSSLGATTAVNHSHGHTFTATTVIAGTTAGSTPNGDHKTAVSIEAETQTSHSNMKGANTEVCLGSMRIRQHTMSVLLVFGKEDTQSDSFWWAADKGGYKCNLARNAETALECYLDKHHDLVIIDHRHGKFFDAEALCRSIRATKSNEHTIVIAVTKKYGSDKEEPSILPLITAGFNRRFMENTSTSVCLNELIAIEHSELRSQIKLQAANALLTAAENVSDAVEITSEAYEVQYVNPAYERIFGYTSEEIMGQDINELPRSERNKADTVETIKSSLKKGKAWEGTFHSKRKSGENVTHHCRITPVNGQSGKVRHLVSIRNPNMEVPLGLEKYNSFDGTNDRTSGALRKSSFDMKSISSSDGGYSHYAGRRRDSGARVHSMTIEAPITKVINIINGVQESSTITVAQSLDKVLEILRSSELYNPHLINTVQDDQMTSDLVGGLMTTGPVADQMLADQRGMKRRFSTTDAINKSGASRDLLQFWRQYRGQPLPPIQNAPPAPSSLLSQTSPEILKVLEKEPTWDFDVLKLETISQKRPLVYLGLKTFQRFGVMDFLRVSEQTVSGWLSTIEANYRPTNSYHNSTHAADVLHASAFFLQTEKLKTVLDEMDVVSSLIAAVVHDVDHPGKTNAFLINSGSKLAMLYNDVAVLESHHAAFSFKVTQKDERINIFKNLDREDFRTMRQQVIDMVLATEMTKHFEHLNKFVSSCIKPPNLVKVEEDGPTNLNRSTSASTSDLSTPENRTFIKRMLIKCADVANPCRPLNLCIEWAKRISEEYFLQTEEEKDRGLPVVMPVFDRTTCNISKSQTSFIDFFINDMFDAFDALIDLPELMEHLQKNYTWWKDQEEAMGKELEKQQSKDEDSPQS